MLLVKDYMMEARLSNMSNKMFIFTCLDVLSNAGKLNDDNINILSNQELCNMRFNCKFPILAEVPMLGDIDKEYYMDNTVFFAIAKCNEMQCKSVTPLRVI